jgi:hypothetical protein
LYDLTGLCIYPSALAWFILFVYSKKSTWLTSIQRERLQQETTEETTKKYIQQHPYSALQIYLANNKTINQDIIHSTNAQIECNYHNIQLAIQDMQPPPNDDVENMRYKLITECFRPHKDDPLCHATQIRFMKIIEEKTPASPGWQDLQTWLQDLKIQDLFESKDLCQHNLSKEYTETFLQRVINSEFCRRIRPSHSIQNEPESNNWLVTIPLEEDFSTQSYVCETLFQQDSNETFLCEQLFEGPPLEDSFPWNISIFLLIIAFFYNTLKRWSNPTGDDYENIPDFERIVGDFPQLIADSLKIFVQFLGYDIQKRREKPIVEHSFEKRIRQEVQVFVRDFQSLLLDYDNTYRLFESTIIVQYRTK